VSLPREALALLRILGSGWGTVLCWPRTLATLVGVLGGGESRRLPGGLWAFSKMDAGFRPAYNKIARAFAAGGRLGYEWHDGLGMPLGARAYNNLVTYTVLRLLGTRRMQAVGYVLMVAASGWVCGLAFGGWMGVAVALLAAGSPLIVGCYTHLGKPETLWWGFVPGLTFLALSGEACWAGLWWSLLAWVSLPASVMVALLLGPVAVFEAVRDHSVLLWLAGASPGLAKHVVRVVGMWRGGMLQRLVSEQARIWKRPWRPRADEMIVCLPFAASVVLSAWASDDWWRGGLLLLSTVGLFWANYRIICLNDSTSYFLGFWTIGLSLATVAHAPLGGAALLLFAYSHPGFFAFPPYVSFSYAEPQVLERWHTEYRGQVTQYPGLRALPLPQPEELMSFVRHIPDGARCLFESDGDPRTQSRFRAFRVWLEDVLPQRRIELANGEYTTILEPLLAQKYLVRFNTEQMRADEIAWLCRLLGVSHVLAFRDVMLERLRGVGFEVVATVNLRTLTEFREIVGTPRETLTLLGHPASPGVIEPGAECRWGRNSLSWEAQAGCDYVIRYRWAKGFRARQNGTVLPVTPTEAVAGLPLRFMRVRAPATGPVMLEYHGSWV